jgi:hypothetical protein
MTRENILRIWPNASPSTIARNLDHAGDSGPSNPVQKEPALLQRGTTGPAKPRVAGRKNKGEAGGDHPRFAVSIDFKISDRRTHDLDGMLASILDCLTTARRRLLDMDSQGGSHRNEG